MTLICIPLSHLCDLCIGLCLKDKYDNLLDTVDDGRMLPVPTLSMIWSDSNSISVTRPALSGARVPLVATAESMAMDDDSTVLQRSVLLPLKRSSVTIWTPDKKHLYPSGISLAKSGDRSSAKQSASVRSRIISAAVTEGSMDDLARDTESSVQMYVVESDIYVEGNIGDGDCSVKFILSGGGYEPFVLPSSVVAGLPHKVALRIEGGNSSAFGSQILRHTVSYSTVYNAIEMRVLDCYNNRVSPSRMKHGKVFSIN
jgi:hypothetical protein